VFGRELDQRRFVADAAGAVREARVVGDPVGRDLAIEVKNNCIGANSSCSSATSGKTGSICGGDSPHWRELRAGGSPQAHCPADLRRLRDPLSRRDGIFLEDWFGTTGSAFGPGVTVAQQGDAVLQATPAPIATEPPGTFTVPQTGTGPVAGGAGGALPGQQTGGGTPAGPPAPVMAAVTELRGRIARNPKDLAALVTLGNMEFDARKFDTRMPSTRAR